MITKKTGVNLDDINRRRALKIREVFLLLDSLLVCPT